MSRRDIYSFAEELLRMMPYIIRGMLRKKTDKLLLGKISIPQYLTLDLLDTPSSLRMKDIAEKLSISLPATTSLVDRLFRMGMLKRIYSKKDRRVIYIVLTSKGKKTIEQLRVNRRRAIEEVFAKLTSEERETYLNILRKIMKVLYPEKR